MNCSDSVPQPASKQGKGLIHPCQLHPRYSSSLTDFAPVGTKIVFVETGEAATVSGDGRLLFRGEDLRISTATRRAAGGKPCGVGVWDKWQTQEGETLRRLQERHDKAVVASARKDFAFANISRLAKVGEGPSEVDNSPKASGDVTAHFGDLAGPMCDFIESADFVVGCVAWLTHSDVIDSLASRPLGCQIIVQKEDFLRPDIDKGNNWHRALRRRYSKLDCKFGRQHMCPPGEGWLSYCYWPEVEAVRCVGNHNSDRKPAFPRMHHKFVVACKENHLAGDGWDWRLLPQAVWTGSFNATANGTRSRENAVVINDPTIAGRYYTEWWSMLGLSETLDWRSVWMEPEYHIGS